MNITELLDNAETLKTEEDIREICYTSNIPRDSVRHRDLLVTNFEYNLDSEIVLHTQAVMLETSDAELWIDVIGDNSRKKIKHKFVNDQQVSWSYPYKAHNLNHGKIAIREFYIEYQTQTNTIDQILSHNIRQPTLLSKEKLFVKFEHDFDHEYLKHIEGLAPDTRDYTDVSQYGAWVSRLDSKQILVTRNQIVKGDRETGLTYRTEFLKIPEFRKIWNRSLELVGGARNLKVDYDANGNVLSRNNMLMGAFSLDFVSDLNSEMFDVTIWIPQTYVFWDEEEGVYKKNWQTEEYAPCRSTVVGLILYLPTSAEHEFHIAAHMNSAQNRSIWEHTVYPGEAVFISNELKYELLHYDQDFSIHGFNVVSFCPSDLIERLHGSEFEESKQIRQEMINTIQ